MRKIKGFKLVLRPAEIKRRAKKAGLDLAAMGQDELALQKSISTATKAIAPGVLFETFKQPDPDGELLSPLPGLAYSVILATLGPGFEPVRQQAAAESESHGALWTILQETALDETVHFVAALIEEEAAKETCVLSPWSPVTDPGALEVVLRRLDSSKIDVRLQDGRLDPSASIAVSLSWLVQSKSRTKKK
jgi:hypothetical protein